MFYLLSESLEFIGLYLMWVFPQEVSQTSIPTRGLTNKYFHKRSHKQVFPQEVSQTSIPTIDVISKWHSWMSSLFFTLQREVLLITQGICLSEQAVVLLCRVVFCNYKNPLCDSVQICSPKGVGEQHEGGLDLWPGSCFQWTVFFVGECYPCTQILNIS